MQLASFKIWTRVTVSISNGDDHYTTGITIMCIFLSVETYLRIISFNDPVMYIIYMKR